jgi:ribosome-binding protein aMBF1 (putative translation factor)
MKIKAYKSFKQWHKEQMVDPKFRKAHEEIAFEFAIIDAIIRQRIKKGITQKQLAEKVGTKQSAISRFERGGSNPHLNFTKKLLAALGLKLVATAI